MSFSTAFKAGLNAQEMTLAYRLIITLDHTDLGAPIRLVDGPEDISHDSNTYLACGFQLVKPEQREEGFRNGRITLNNVDGVVTAAIRSLPSDITIDVRRVSATNLGASPPEYDTIEGGTTRYYLLKADLDDKRAQLSIGFKDTTLRRFPDARFNPTDFQGLYKE